MGSALEQFFGQSDAILLTVALALMMMLVGFMVQSHFTPAGRRERLRRRTFRDFAAANALTGPETSTLLRVARHCHLENPVFIFVRRSLFESSVPDLEIPEEEAEAIRGKVYAP